MGAKSTMELTRVEAERKYVYLYEEIMRRHIKAQAVGYTNTELESVLERMNDEINDGEGFMNYLII